MQVSNIDRSRRRPGTAAAWHAAGECG